MGVLDSVKGFYFSLEDKYYHFLDWLDEKGIPVYKVVDPIEAANIPSFPIFILLILLILVGLVWILAGSAFAGTSTVSLIVNDAQGTGIPNAIVAFKIGTNEPVTVSTNSEGKVERTVPIGTELSITVSKDGFEPKTLSFTAQSPTEQKLVTLNALAQTISKTINLVDSATNAQYAKPVTVRFSCTQNASFTADKSTTNGIIELTGIPSDCGLLSATSVSTGVSFSQGIIDLQSPGIASLSVSEQATETGTVRVRAQNEAGQAVANVNVKLLRENGTQFSSRATPQSGTIEFADVPAGRYYVITVDQVNQQYADYDSSAENDIRSLEPNSEIEFSVVLKAIVFGKIRLVIQNQVDNQPVANATVTLVKNGVELYSNNSAENGSVELAISDTGATYSVRVDHPSFLIATVSDLHADSSIHTVLLTPVSGSNATSLEVQVLDPAGAPIENAQVQLKKNADASVASEVLVTGANGKAVFTRLIPDTYFAFVVKDGFEGVTSEPVTVTERQTSFVTVVLPIGTGTIILTALDDTQQPIASVNVKMIDFFSRAVLAEGLNNIDGTKSFTVRADKTVFFELSSNDFAPFTTIPYMVAANGSRSIAVSLLRDIVKLDVQFNGFFIGDESASDALTAGQRYRAKLLLLVPENVEWDEAGIHLRTGAFEDNKTNLMESDYLFLGRFWSASHSVLRGKSFSPPVGTSEDNKHVTTGNSKWLTGVFKEPQGGVFEIETEVQVVDTTPIGSLLPFSYRAFGKTAGLVNRSPVDAALGNNETTSSKQGLYAKTFDHFFTVGPSTLCNDQFCHLLIVEDQQNNLRSTVVDEFPAQLSSNYKLFFTLINKSGFLYSNAALEISSLQGGLKLGDFKLTDASGKTFSGAASANKVLQNISDMGKDASLFGEVFITTQKQGIQDLRLGLLSNQQTAFQKTVSFNVQAAADLNLDILPKTIAPFLTNDLLIRVTDHNSGQPVANASIELFVNDELVISGNTDSEGIFKYALQSPAPGWKIKIVARATGFSDTTKELMVSTNLLTIIPDSVNESLTVNGTFGFEKDFILINNSVAPLTITDLRLSDEFKPFLDVRFDRELRGTILGPGQDTNVLMQVELTEQAKRLTEPLELQGHLSVFSTFTELDKTWASLVPFNIRIGFGGEVDDQKCISLVPDKWTVVTGLQEAQTISIKLTNACKSQQRFVSLSNVSAKIQENPGENLLGQFTLSSDLDGAQTLSLTNALQPIATGIASNVDPALSISFVPFENIVSGKGAAQITIQAIHATNNGPQTIEAKINVETIVNDLASCVQVAPTDLIVHSTPPGIGFGNYDAYGYGGLGSGYGGAGSGYGGFNSYYGGRPGLGGTNSGYNRFDTGGAYGNYYNQFLNGTQTINGNPTLVDYPERLYATNYPYAGYSEPFYDTWAPNTNDGYLGQNANYYNNQFGAFNFQNSFYGRNNQFRITNNCASPVEIGFDADPALLVSNQKLVIEPDQQQIVPIESTHYYGFYPLNVRAKIAQSKGISQVIQTLNVNVLPANDPTQFDNCIRLSTTKFRFNDFIQKPVTARVYNSCFAQGVRIELDSIAFNPQGYGEQFVSPQSGSGVIEAIEPISLINVPGSNGIQQVLEFEVFKNINYRPQISESPGIGGPGDISGLRLFATGTYNRVQARTQLVVRYATPQGLEQRKVFRVLVDDFWNALNAFPVLCTGNPFAKADDCLIKESLDYGACLTTAEFANKQTYSYNARQVLRVGPNPYEQNPGYNNYCGNTTAYPNQYGSAGYGGYGNIANGSRYGGTYQAPGGVPYSRGDSFNRLYQPSYAPTTYPQPYPYYAPNYSVPSQGHFPGYPSELVNVCGSLDKVSIESQTIVKNGIKFTFTTGVETNSRDASLNQKIKLTVDKSGATVGGETRVDAKIKIQVVRQNAFQTSYLEIPVKVCVDLGTRPDLDDGPGPGPTVPIVPSIPSTPNAQTPAAFLCPNPEYATGSEGYKAFENLLLDWTWGLGQTGDDTDGKICETKYCDAVQETISLVKKTKKIDDWFNKSEVKTAIAKNTPNVQAVFGKDNVDEYKTSLQATRWIIKQKTIDNDAELQTTAGGTQEFKLRSTPQKLVFFLNSENKPADRGNLDSEKYPDVKIIQNPESTAQQKIDSMSGLLQKLAGQKGVDAVDADSILVLVNKWWNKDTDSDATILAELGLSSVSDTTYAFTLNEFGYLHQELKKCATADNTATTCAIVGKTKTVQVNTALLSQLANNISARYAARHTPDFYGKIDAKTFSGELETGITTQSVIELVLAMIGRSNLIQDVYSSQFSKDFASLYGTTAPSTHQEITKKVGEWKIDGSVDKTGQYLHIIEYTWAPTKKTSSVTLSFSKEPEQNNNLLYNLPLDASLQTSSGTRDYGTVLSGTNTERLLWNDQTKALSGSSGFKTHSFSFVNDAIDPQLQKGSILKLSNGSATFSPTTPYGFVLVLSGTNNGALLNFSEPKLNQKIQWKQFTEGTGTQNGICKNNKGEAPFGLKQQNDSGLLFIPADLRGIVFSVVCANQPATMQVNQGTVFSNQGPLIATQNKTATKDSRADFDLTVIQITKQMSLKALAEAVKNNQACVKATADSLEITWNPKYVLPNAGNLLATSSPLLDNRVADLKKKV